MNGFIVGCSLASKSAASIVTIFLRSLPMLGMGMVILGSVLLLLLLIGGHKTKVDPLFYGTSRQTHALTGTKMKSGYFSVSVCVC